MTEHKKTWPDFVEAALFEKDPARRAERLAEARRAVHDRLLDLSQEVRMLEDASKKLDEIDK